MLDFEPRLTYRTDIEKEAQTALLMLADGEVWGCRGLSQQDLERPEPRDGL